MWSWREMLYYFHCHFNDFLQVQIVHNIIAKSTMQIFMVTYDVKTFDLEKTSSLISLGIGILRPKSGGGRSSRHL